jgi:protein ERP2
VIYFDFQAGDEEPKWKSMGGENTALTSLEMSSVTMHESLKVGLNSTVGRQAYFQFVSTNKFSKAACSFHLLTILIYFIFQVVVDYQTHHRLREAQARDRAEYLNERVQYWSIGESVLIVILSIGQVFVLRRFFAEKRSNI